jgi:hypothetical protein
MKVKTYSYVVKVTDEDNKHIEQSDLPDGVFEDICENLADGIWEGDVDYEDDSDEWADMNRGDEIRDYRKNDC